MVRVSGGSLFCRRTPRTHYFLESVPTLWPAPEKADSSPATSELFVPRAPGAHGSLNPRGKRALRGGGEAHKVTYKNQLSVISIAAAFPGAHPWRLILLYKLALFKSGGEDKDGR